MFAVPLALAAPILGLGGLLLWPLIGGYSLLLAPVFASIGVAILAELAGRARASSADGLGLPQLTDHLVAELRRTADGCPTQRDPGPHEARKRISG